MKAIHAIPLSVALRELVPLRTSHQDPPDSVEGLIKISRFSAFSRTARFSLLRFKLIFLGAL
jgi:hypothetical protein